MSSPLNFVGHINAVESQEKFICKWEINEFIVYPMLDLEAHRLRVISPVIHSAEFKFHILLEESRIPNDRDSIFITLIGVNLPYGVEVKPSFSVLNYEYPLFYQLHYAEALFTDNTDDVSMQSFRSIGSASDFERSTRICSKASGSAHAAQVIGRKTLIDHKHNLVTNGKLTVLCEMTIYNKFLAQKQNALEDTCKFAVNSNFEKFFNNKKFSDVKFVVDAEHFYAHKNVLANRSEVFAAMFEHDMKENLEI